MALLKFLRLLLSQPLADLSAESLNQQTATHADAAMNTPHSQGETQLFQRLVPREHMLIDAIDESAVKIEKQRWCDRCLDSWGRRSGNNELTSQFFNLRQALLVFKQRRDH